MSTFAEELHVRAKAEALALFTQAMNVAWDRGSYIDAGGGAAALLFEKLTAQLAFARLLEDELLRSLRRCPDKTLAGDIEEAASVIAGELGRVLKEPRR